ncbi:23S rRNA pseudouridine(1911/1915/1917) synthase RluD [Blochmannia endosymbiont of Camponotus modoc]|uniref:23S rRNA pseudouridine(1911/1915/1917) synthase RluD n=1 Tax=Blochmannia endosymbiont of Camponotus modoc TaxID=2945587 RepID=UPI0020245D48|nr:23S rRNA pseudouridine(1911/1915/1917) synthase RluD [Blochmannia endosymbiont of Camponotus modoc]URJ29258.1 23S rRNA pseudouridine(1911/1915/1917) synthase RluD [Blochmannia endosymbiont of Camponotus modoc]
MITLESYIIKPMIVQASQSGKRLDCVLSELLPNYSRSKIKCWILSKKVNVNNQTVIIPKKKMMGGEFIEIQDIVNIDNNSIVPQDIPLDIVYEDDDIVVINKAKNMVVHPGAGNHSGTILNALLYKYPAITEVFQSGIVQRLDKDTTGLMVVAKNMIAYHSLLRLFKKRKIIREYDAVVLGNFLHNEGTINQPIRRHAVHRTRMTVNPMGKPAITHYSITESFSMYTRIRVRLETGRTHQIRVHMAYINHPLLGDHKYGKSTYFIKGVSDAVNDCLHVLNRQALHATTLQLCHPITRIKMKWDVPLPKDIIKLINILRKNERHVK